MSLPLPSINDYFYWSRSEPSVQVVQETGYDFQSLFSMLFWRLGYIHAPYCRGSTAAIRAVSHEPQKE